MAARLRIAIVGPGRLGSALAMALRQGGYRISEVVSKEDSRSRRKAQLLARSLGGARAVTADSPLSGNLVWIAVPDRKIAPAARQLARSADWKGRVVLHSSGALSSDELRVLRRRGAAVASAHPLMTFVRGSIPSLREVPFALEGDAAAMSVARRVVRRLGGHPFSISARDKPAYHAWGAFTSPLLVALLATAERVANVAGQSRADARKRMLPILRQTLANYAKLGAAGALSGPIVRGDVEIVRKHLHELQRIPEAKAVYTALARAGLRYLPRRNQREMKKLLEC
jgi:predicted short-subunit dehydrogenase-like oxidoreductase (DUF2520 family)